MGGNRSGLHFHKKILAVLVSVLMVESLVPDVFTQTARAATEETPVKNEQIEVTTKENDQDVDRKWQLVWNDEFNGDSLDKTKWDYQVGTGAEYVEDGWGNKEQEYYTDGENAKLEDGNLVITAKKNTDASKYAGKAYTSARLWTKGSIDAKENGTKEAGTSGGPALYAKKYGRFEASMSLPKGTGYWPAFWLMPAYDKYGSWASSGELDIMEARGRETNKVDGTVHYGDVWPNNKSNGGHYEDADFDITKKHLYAVEWEPGEIRWYVDNKLYYKTSEFYSLGSGNAENYTYPAPFDQPFYIILNLAVGGNYDSGQLDTSIDQGQMKVDYVRVYDKVDDDNQVGNYDENVLPTVKEVGELHGGTGNLTASSMESINKVVNDYATESSDGWDLLALTGFGGKADATYEEGGAKIKISNPGTQDYSVQLTHKLPLTYGYGYHVSFKAKAASNRSIKMKLGEAGGGYAAYTDTSSFDLTSDWKEYNFDFKMLSNTDDQARLEMNLGLNSSTVQIKDVVVQTTGKIKERGENESKEPTAVGQQIYNGTFDQGNKVNEQNKYTRLKYWNVTEADATVDSQKREVKLISDGTSNSAALTQKGIQLLKNDNYKLTFKARADEVRDLTVLIKKADGTTYNSKKIALTKEDQEYEMSFDMTEPKDDMAEVSFVVDKDTTPVYLDDISLIRTTNNNVDYSNVKLYLVENGDFKAGLAGWNKYQTDAGVDQVGDENVAWVAAAPCEQDYDKMLLYNDLSFSQGIQYTMNFKAKTTSSKKQKITLRIQREGGDWKSVLDEAFDVTDQWQDYHYTFTPDFSGTLNLKYLLGGVTEGCNLNLKDVELYVTQKPLLRSGFLYDQESSKVGEDVSISYVDHDGWAQASGKKIYVNKKEVSEDDFKINQEKGQLILNKDLFKEPGNYSIAAATEGYDKSNVATHTVHDASGNLLVNGSFDNELNGWGSYFTNNCGQVTVTEDKEAKVSFIWHEGNTWDLQLYQENIALQKGKKYQIQFAVRSSIDRDITVEFGKASGATPLATVSLTKDKKVYSFTYDATTDETAKINFLMGNVNGCSNDNNPHDIYLDDVSVSEVKKEEASPSPDPTQEPEKKPEETIKPTESEKPVVSPQNSAAPTAPTSTPAETIKPSESPVNTVTPTPVPQTKLKVGKLHVVKQTANSIKVSWNKNKKASSYEVRIYQGKKCMIKKTTKKNSYTFNKLKPATKYVIKVRPVKGSGQSLTWVTAPLKVTKISIKKNAKGGYQVRWSKVSGASGYRVQLKMKNKKSKQSKDVASKTSYRSKANTVSIVIQSYKKINNKKVYSAVSKTIKMK